MPSHLASSVKRKKGAENGGCLESRPGREGKGCIQLGPFSEARVAAALLSPHSDLLTTPWQLAREGRVFATRSNPDLRCPHPLSECLCLSPDSVLYSSFLLRAPWEAAGKGSRD